MITAKQERKRIDELIQSDNATDRLLDQETKKTLEFIKEHLTSFYMHYAGQTGLTISQTMQSVSKWDLEQWKNAVKELSEDGWSPEAKDRISALGVVAGISLGMMMSSIAGLAVTRQIDNQVIAVKSRVKQDQQQEIKRVNQSFSKPVIKSKLLPAPDLSDRLWLEGDRLIADLQSSLYRSFVTATDIEDFRALFQAHLNPNQFNPDKNIGDRLKQQNYVIGRLLRTETARMKDYINSKSYRDNGIEWVNIVTEPGACAKCLSLSVRGPYPIDEAPSIPDDTHPNCRCGKVPAMGPDDTLDNPKPYQQDEDDDSSVDLTDAEQMALNQYISSDSYKLNDMLRRGEKLPSEYEEMATNLDSALEKLPKYSDDAPLYRSLTFIDNESAVNYASSFELYKEVASNAYLSTSKSIYNSADTVRLVINKSFSGRDLVGYNDGEMEVLFSRNSTFVVVDRYLDENRKPIIVLEEKNE